MRSRSAGTPSWLAILAVSCAAWLATAGGALAHGSRPSTAQVQQHEQEARGLTDELRQRSAATAQAQRRKELLSALAESRPSAVIDLALMPDERANLPAGVRAL